MKRFKKNCGRGQVRSIKTQRSGLWFFLIARQVDGRPTRYSVRAPLGPMLSNEDVAISNDDSVIRFTSRYPISVHEIELAG